MYTFGILAGFFLILSGIIFKGRIKANQFIVDIIVVADTLIGSIIINGVLGLDVPYTLSKVKTKELSKLRLAKVIDLKDTLFHEYACIDYRYIKELKKNGDTSFSDHYIELGSPDMFYIESNHRKSENIGRTVHVHFLSDGDSIPYYDKMKYKRILTNKWISTIGLPRGGTEYHVYMPNDSIHNVLMTILNEKYYYKNETEEIAQLN